MTETESDVDTDILSHDDSKIPKLVKQKNIHNYDKTNLLTL